MEFTVVVENTLNGVQLEFDSSFGVADCFEESDSMLFLLCKYLKIEEGQYNSVGEVIDEFSDELEDCIKVVEIKDFPIYCKTASFKDVQELFCSDINEKKVKALLEYGRGGIGISRLLEIDWDSVKLFEGVNSNFELGRFIVNEKYGSLISVPKEILENYFDYERYGIQYSLGGKFTKEGFIIV